MSKKNTKKNADEIGSASGKAAEKTEVISPLQLSMHEKFADLFVVSMFTIFPIYMTNMLFDVREDRLHYFVVTTFILLFFIAATYICGIDKERWPKHIFKMSVSDWSFISFVAVCLISACLSEYGEEAFTGSGGRNSGFWLMAMYLLCYLLVSRYFKYTEPVFTAFTIMSSVVCFIAVLHEFHVDPFKILVDIKAEQQKDFITTIGNINMFSGFVCVSLPVCTALAVLSKDKVSTAFYTITAGINFMGLVVANSMSGYFGLVAFMSVLFVYCCGNTQRLYKFFLEISMLLLSVKVLRLISLIFNDDYKNLEDISNFLVYDRRIFIALGVSIMLTVFAYLFKVKKEEKDFPKWVQIAAGIFIALCALAVLGVFIYFSFIDKETDLGKFKKVLRLNDQWGTHRGYAWIRGMILFKSNGIKNILVGSGPDTFGQLIKGVYREDMLKRHGSVFDTAHNEFLNYLVTTGLLGLISYVTLIGSLLWRLFKRGKNNTPFVIAALAIVAYCSQSVFNLATPIITPYVFLFFGIAEALIRCYDTQRENENKKA